MLDFETARAQLLAGHVCRLADETVCLSESIGRVLAQPLAARYPSPLFDNSAMDGYAVCDQKGGLQEFTVVDRIMAGDLAETPLQHGQAARIFTGAALPPHTTSVVLQEDCHIDGDHLLVNSPIRSGQHMRMKAEEIAEGSELLPQGFRLDAAAIGLAASQGYHELPVYRKLRAVVFSSGNELTEPGQALQGSKIYDANRYQLVAWLRALNVAVKEGGILPDDLPQTEVALKKAGQEYDIIITSGGASVGDADYLKQALQNIGNLIEHSVAIKPGKPFSWGRVGNADVFVLPGNPVSAFVTARILLRPVLNKLAGRCESDWLLPELEAKADFSTAKAIKRREFLRVRVEAGAEGGSIVRLLANQGSAMLGTCVAANALCEVPPGVKVEKGDSVRVLLLPE
ncbi:MAG: molybdopterin molybdotransferase MoeA [Neisseria sp.]|uniref:molybdopterin molybdotransferase MoeA n=1 Tax=Neisseria sp. TaxID=192066 RepID=UPI0026DD606D|nr:gephyrin-like molybdotransferase Glp [Neisseria sp.]MDO4640144.1 molybdopterin molybdotransferase MoeA [Neisseria sp.]